MSKHKKRNAFYWIIWEVNTVNEIWLAYVILQKEKFYEKFYKTSTWRLVPGPFVHNLYWGMKFLKQSPYIRYVIAKLSSFVEVSKDISSVTATGLEPRTT